MIDKMQETVKQNPGFHLPEYLRDWKVLLLIFVIVALVLSAIIRVLTPLTSTQVPLSTFSTVGIRNTSTSFANITFSGTFAPPEGDFYVVEATQTDVNEDVLTRLIEKYALTPLQNVPGIWRGPDYSLTRDQITQQYTLVKEVVPENPSRIQTSRALEVANTFLQNDLGIQNFQPIQKDIEYYTDPIELTPSNEFKAEIMIIPFAPTLGNTPVFFSKITEYPLELYINSNYDVQKATFLPYTYEILSQRNTSLITVDAAIKNINDNKASIISMEGRYPGIIAINEIISGTLTSASVEYRLDSEQNLMYPFYRFIGSAMNNQNQTLEVEILTPAVRTN